MFDIKFATKMYVVHMIQWALSQCPHWSHQHKQAQVNTCNRDIRLLVTLFYCDIIIVVIVIIISFEVRYILSE